ncbi:unnamed protein product [Chrysoparadoxa australica]
MLLCSPGHAKWEAVLSTDCPLRPEKEALRADKDSFYWTNIAPMHENAHTRAGREWSEMEDRLLEVTEMSNGQRMNMFTGCIFTDQDIELVPTKPSDREGDNVRAPQYLWCVAAWSDAETSELRSRGYIIDNYHVMEDGTIDFNPADGLDRSNEVPIATLGEWTDIDFGDALLAADIQPSGAGGRVSPVLPDGSGGLWAPGSSTGFSQSTHGNLDGQGGWIGR